MLTTTGFRNFGLEMDGTTSGSTLIFLPGTAQISGGLMPWNGTQVTLDSISTFSGPSDAGLWQNALIYLYNDSTATRLGTDMTVSYSAKVADQSSLLPPVMASEGYPLSLFTLHTTTGSDCTLFQSTHL